MLLAMALGPALAGCNTPYFHQYDADAGSVAMDAKQRVVYSVKRGPPGEQRQVVCAEPSPDAVTAEAMQTAASLAAKLPGAVAGAPVSTEAQAALQHSLAEQVAYIGVRNSTIQLLRDGLYRACEAYMNGAVGDFGYSLVLANYGRVMVALLSTEGLTRPPFNGPVTIGAAIPPAAVAAGSGSASITPGSGGSPASPAQPTPVTFSASTVNADMAKALQGAYDLADPNRTTDRTLLDLVTACIMWQEDSPMRSPRVKTEDLHQMCDTIIQNLPRRMDHEMTTEEILRVFQATGNKPDAANLLQVVQPGPSRF